jgi:predicted nucleic acid-binding protein
MLYLDASALVKMYLPEPASTQVRAAVAAASSAVSTSAIAYAELRAAFARALREHRVDAAGYAAVLRLFEAHWLRYVLVVVDDARLREAGRLSEHHTRHALRALDAIHLSCALQLAGGDPSSVTFACWDLRLWRAARDEGFTTLPATEPL